MLRQTDDRYLGDSMAASKDVALANKKDAFMRRMRSGPWPERSRLYGVYERDRWTGVHQELVRMLRVAKRDRNTEHADQLGEALGEVLQYQTEGYGLGRCVYVPADLPRGAKREEIEEYEQRGIFPSRKATVLDPRTAKFFAHFFLCASAKRIPQWCPEHSLAARQRQDRQKKLKARRAGKYT